MIRISNGTVPDDHKFHDTPMSVDWLNAVQDEICYPIEKMQGKLLPSNDQLKHSINQMISEEKVELKEVSDYSGNPVLIPDFKLSRNDVTTVYLLCEIYEKKSILCNSVPDFLGDIYYNKLTDFDISSNQFNEFVKLLSSDSLYFPDSNNNSNSDWIKILNYSLYDPPSHPSLSKDQIKTIIQAMNAKRLIENQDVLTQYVFTCSPNGYMNHHEFDTLADLTPFLSLFSANGRGISEDMKNGNVESSSILQEWAYLFFYFIMLNGSKPMSPLFLVPDSEGKVYSIYNKMVYGDYLKIKFGLINRSK